jgi:hypothetical protein
MSDSSNNRQSVWEAETNHPELCATLREGLRELLIPSWL